MLVVLGRCLTGNFDLFQNWMVPMLTILALFATAACGATYPKFRLPAPYRAGITALPAPHRLHCRASCEGPAAAVGPATAARTRPFAQGAANLAGAAKRAFSRYGLGTIASERDWFAVSVPRRYTYRLRRFPPRRWGLFFLTEQHRRSLTLDSTQRFMDRCHRELSRFHNLLGRFIACSAVHFGGSGV
jgi:hypothetical protein